ncbi:formate/nitrite transporter family protein [Henriciella aquimarina]|uniref:formate/nitrite transporter family protein n=1 Tax=Henriciella aquimarina TaxID=545261 RepID=UPI0009FE0001|nr:formate/nitrite transporter family protein [Henriciella aquimarina]
MSGTVQKSPEHAEEDQITEEERFEAARLTKLKSRMVYEVIRQEGRSELSRPQSSIWWSGIAAGISISISLAMEAMLRTGLPDREWRPLIENFGYASGFLIVMLGRMQLFTENTLTVVLPTLADPCKRTILGTARLWSTVFLANMIGTAVAAAFFVYGGALQPEVKQAAVEIGHHVAGWTAWETFLKAMPAGFLVAALVWIRPGSEGNEFWVIVFFTYLIALGDFAHVVVGATELFLVGFEGDQSFLKLIGVNLLPTLMGNIIGGAGLFAMLAWGQVHAEVQEPEKSR